MFKRDVILAQEYLAFTLLNLFDLILTGVIYSHGGQEANGLAALVLSRFGLFGPAAFVLYKFLLVAVVIGACETISMQSVRKARLIVILGCVVYVCVVFWECFQIFIHVTGPFASS